MKMHMGTAMYGMNINEAHPLQPQATATQRIHTSTETNGVDALPLAVDASARDAFSCSRAWAHLITSHQVHSYSHTQSHHE